MRRTGQHGATPPRGRGRGAEATDVSDGDGCDDRGQEVDEDDEPHREAAESAELVDEDELGQVVDGRVDPSSSLREQHAPLVRSDRLCERGSDERRLVLGEVLEEERGQVSILSEVKQVLQTEKCEKDERE